MAKKIRLEAAGYFNDDGVEISESVYDRAVILVYTGSFESMDGPVTIREEHISLLHDTHNDALTRIKRLKNGEIPMRSCPPLQLDHSTSAQHTIGRLIGALSMGHVDINGETCLALFGTARFLGKENVEKAKDGRWTHVSIGADLESGTLSELSVTPFPAAPNASLLSKNPSDSEIRSAVEVAKRIYSQVSKQAPSVDSDREGIISLFFETSEEASKAVQLLKSNGRFRSVQKDGDSVHAYLSSVKNKGETEMYEKLKKHLMEKKKLSEQDAEKASKECLSHHMSKMEMDEEKMSAHMAAADDEELKRMSDTHDEELKKLSAEKEEKDKEEKEKEEKLSAEKEEKEEKEKEAKLSAKTRFVKLAKGIKSEGVKLKKEIRLAAITTRLSSLRAMGKLSPAEIRKIDLSKYEKMSDEEVAAAMNSYDALEPRVQFGAMSGTTKAEAISKIHEKYRLSRLEHESRMNMPSKRKEAEARLSRLADDEKRELAEVGSKESVEPVRMTVKHAELCKMLEEGKHDDLKYHLKRLCDQVSYLGEQDLSEGDHTRMSALAKNYSALQNQFEELVAMASPVLGVESDEI